MSISDVLLREFRNKEVILNGHFVGSSGRHLATYVQKDRIFCDPDLFSTVLGQGLQLSRTWAGFS